jgi:hypothetical protein
MPARLSHSRRACRVIAHLCHRRGTGPMAYSAGSQRTRGGGTETHRGSRAAPRGAWCRSALGRPRPSSVVARGRPRVTLGASQRAATVDSQRGAAAWRGLRLGVRPLQLLFLAPRCPRPMGPCSRTGGNACIRLRWLAVGWRIWVAELEAGAGRGGAVAEWGSAGPGRWPAGARRRPGRWPAGALPRRHRWGVVCGEMGRRRGLGGRDRRMKSERHPRRLEPSATAGPARCHAVATAPGNQRDQPGLVATALPRNLATRLQGRVALQVSRIRGEGSSPVRSAT